MRNAARLMQQLNATQSFSHKNPNNLFDDPEKGD